MAYGGGYAAGYGGAPAGTTFNAPVYNVRWGAEIQGHGREWSLWRYYEPMLTYVQTVIISGGTVTPAAGVTKTFTPSELAAADSGSGEGGKAVFRGRLTHEVNSSEATLLAAAGYTVD